LAELRAVFDRKVFSAVIDDDEAVARAPAAKQAVLTYQPAGTAAAAFRQLAEEIIHA
jgi:cellulose biosynthesis protein BcsQ